MASSRRRLACWRALLVVTLGALPLAGCSIIRRPGPVVDSSQDPRIEQEVRARLAAEPSLAANGIRVEVNGGVVLLHGGVSGIGAWQCAIATSGLVPGVRTVVDYLVIERGPRDVRCLAPRPDSGVVTGR